MNVIKLFKEKTASRQGDMFTLTQVYEDNNCYAYNVKRTNGKASWYEVFKKKTSPSITVVDGKFIRNKDELKELYPGDNAFGFWAFHCTEFDGDGEHCCEHYIKKWLSEAQKREGF